MVRDGAKPKRELAACWRVEVMNGAFGERFASVSDKSVTTQGSRLPTSRIFSTSFLSRGSSTQKSVNFPPVLLSTSAEITQKVSGRTARQKTGGENS